MRDTEKMLKLLKNDDSVTIREAINSGVDNPRRAIAILRRKEGYEIINPFDKTYRLIR